MTSWSSTLPRSVPRQCVAHWRAISLCASAMGVARPSLDASVRVAVPSWAWYAIDRVVIGASAFGHPVPLVPSFGIGGALPAITIISIRTMLRPASSRQPCGRPPPATLVKMSSKYPWTVVHANMQLFCTTISWCCNRAFEALHILVLHGLPLLDSLSLIAALNQIKGKEVFRGNTFLPLCGFPVRGGDNEAVCFNGGLLGCGAATSLAPLLSVWGRVSLRRWWGGVSRLLLPCRSWCLRGWLSGRL